jgi:hypothetical protein
VSLHRVYTILYSQLANAGLKPLIVGRTNHHKPTVINIVLLGKIEGTVWDTIYCSIIDGGTGPLY